MSPKRRAERGRPLVGRLAPAGLGLVLGGAFPLAAADGDARRLGMGGASAAVVRDAGGVFGNPAVCGCFGPAPAGEGLFSTPPADRDGLAGRSFGLALPMLGCQLRQTGKVGDARSLLADAQAAAAVRCGQWAVGYRLRFRTTAEYYHQPDAVSEGYAALNAGLDLDYARRLLAGDPTVLAEEQYRFPAERLDLAWIPNAVTVSEVPIAYGRQVLPELSLGLALRLIHGRVTGGRLYAYPDIGSVTDYLSGTQGGAQATYILGDYDLDDTDTLLADHRSTWTLGVDAGALLRSGDWSLGLAAHNLNRPLLRGPDSWHLELLARRTRRLLDPSDPAAILRYFYYPYYDEVIGATAVGIPTGDVHLDTQLTLGAGWQPDAAFTLAVDLDLLSAETVLPGYRERYLRVGLEYTLAEVVDLRAGCSCNLAEDAPPVYHLGLGIAAAPLRIGLALATAARRTDLDGEHPPVDLRAAVSVGVEY